jgi:O-antigen/teichoic acid export membrane protein
MAGMILIGKMDSMMVTSMLGLASNAVYTTAFYMATVIEIPKRALSQIAMPLISRAFEKKDLADILQIYRRTAINQLIIGALILIGIYANLDSIFELIPKKEIYETGKWVVVIVGLGKLMDMAFGPSSEIIVLSKHYAFNIVLILILAITLIVSNNLLIPIYGINGAAYGTALALFLFNFIKFIYLWWALKMQPFSIDTIKVMVIISITLVVNYFLPVMNNFLMDIVYRSLIITTFFSGAILLSGASVEGNKIFKRGIDFLFKSKQ